VLADLKNDFDVDFPEFLTSVPPSPNKRYRRQDTTYAAATTTTPDATQKRLKPTPADAATTTPQLPTGTLNFNDDNIKELIRAQIQDELEPLRSNLANTSKEINDVKGTLSTFKAALDLRLHTIEDGMTRLAVISEKQTSQFEQIQTAMDSKFDHIAELFMTHLPLPTTPTAIAHDGGPNEEPQRLTALPAVATATAKPLRKAGTNATTEFDKTKLARGPVTVNKPLTTLTNKKAADTRPLGRGGGRL
jgi:uncharacterized phage infection (PIP) family protein YhgE